MKSACKCYLSTLTNIIHLSICFHPYVGNVSYSLESLKYNRRKDFPWTLFSSIPKAAALLQLLELPTFGTGILAYSVREYSSTIFAYYKTLLHRGICCKSTNKLCARLMACQKKQMPKYSIWYN